MDQSLILGEKRRIWPVSAPKAGRFRAGPKVRGFAGGRGAARNWGVGGFLISVELLVSFTSFRVDVKIRECVKTSVEYVHST